MQPPERGPLERLGDQRDLEPLIVERSDGEADAANRDRAVLDQVALEPVGDGDAQPPRKAVLAHREQLADAVDVALDDVPAERLAGAQGRLEVDPRAGGELTEG